MRQLTATSKEASPPVESGLRRQFLPNLITNGGVFVLNTLIGLWYTPYLIRHLGVAAYGLVPLALSLTSYLSLINLSLNGAAGRFLTVDLEKQDYDSANRTFNTVLVGNLGVAAATLPFAFGMIWGAPRWFDVPTGQEVYTQWLFAGVLAAYMTMVIQSSFSVSSWARNRFDLRNAVIAVDRIARVLLVVIFFSVTQPTVWHVGLGILGAAALGFMGDFYLWRRLTPQLRVQPTLFDPSRVRQLFGMGGWLIINQAGTLLFLNMELVVANRMLGAEIAGMYGSVLLFSTMLRHLAQTASTVLTPTVLAKYAHGDLKAVNHISQQAVKFLGLAMALPIGLLCGMAQPLLTLWLGPTFQSLAGLLIMLTGHLAINLAVLPLFGINLTFNKVRIPGLVTLGMGLVNVGLAVAFVKLGWGALGIATAGAIVLTLKNALFTPIYAAHIQKLGWWTFLRSLWPPVVAVLAVGGVTLAVTKMVPTESWMTLVGIGGAVSLLYAAITYSILLNGEERKVLMGLLRRKNASAR